MISDNKQLRKLTSSEIANLLGAAQEKLSMIEFTPDAIQQTLNELLESTGQKPGILFSLIRIAVSWAPFSPALNDSLAAIGKEKALARLDRAIAACPEV